MNILFFGPNNPTSECLVHSFISSNNEYDLYLCSRSRHHAYSDFSELSFIHCDLTDPSSFNSEVLLSPFFIYSFSPLWLFAPFIRNLFSLYPRHFDNLKGVIACSSTSVETKRFSSNLFDKQLFSSLECAENDLLYFCNQHQYSLTILRPTLIHGNSISFSDNNFSVIKKILRILPFVCLPYPSGLRQPIHHSQLALVCRHLFAHIVKDQTYPFATKIISLGGDDILSFHDMIKHIQFSSDSNDKIKCRVLFLPYRFFLFLLSPLLIVSPKYFDALARLNSDLSGFTKSSSLLTCSDDLII